MIPVRKEYASYVQLESNRDAPQYLLIPTVLHPVVFPSSYIDIYPIYS